MIIKKLSMYNFGVYADLNTIELNSKKPVVLIGGLNGRGKTTFLEAILLALYGSNSFAFTESKYKTYGEYLRAHVNQNDKSGESYVELEFEMNDESDHSSYTVKRSWNSNKNRMKDKVEVLKNGTYDDFLARNWMMFIESVLPHALSSFFFFDGEKIAEIAENETGSQMKESIKALLGINVLDTLGSDLRKISQKLTNEKSENVDIVTLKKMRLEKENAEDELKRLDNKIDSKKKEILELQKKLNNKKNRFEEKGGDIVQNTMGLYSEQASNNAFLEEINNRIQGIAASEMPLKLVLPILVNILHQSNIEKENTNKKITAKTIENLYSMFNSNSNEVDEELIRFISFVKEEMSETKTHTSFNLSDGANYQLEALIDSRLSALSNELKTLWEQKKKIQTRNDEIASYLAVDINEKEVNRLYKEIKRLEFKLSALEVSLEHLESNRKIANGVYINKKSEFSQYVEKSLSAFEKNDDIERMLSYTLMAEQINEKYKFALQRAKINDLAVTMTKCYKKLLGKKNLIDRIKMDSDSLDYYYLDHDGNEIQKKSLSAGEKQLMVISMLWALALCSKKNLPVIIDTPMARLDSVHRNALIERYFPYASEQTIILSTDSEIYGNYYKLLKKNSSNEFTLVYDEETKCSSVRSGYFEESYDY